MLLKNRKYYDDLKTKILKDHENIDYHTKRALAWRRLYERTKDRCGLYDFINKVAYKRNRYHCLIGCKIAEDDVKRLLWEIDCINDFLEYPYKRTGV